MENNLESRLRLVGWLGSILFHLFLLVFATRLLLQQPRFTVTSGETSTEIELTAAEPDPESVTPPAPPAPVLPPPVIPPIPPVSIPPPQVSPPDAFTVPVPSKIIPALPSPPPVASSLPSKVPAKPHPIHQAATAAPSNASKGAVEAQPDDLHNDPPVYPDESRMAHEEGVVILRVEVTASGEAASVSLKQSSGFFRLDQAARQAVRHWRFHPGMVAGVPVPSEADVPVHFKLERL